LDENNEGHFPDRVLSKQSDFREETFLHEHAAYMRVISILVEAHDYFKAHVKATRSLLMFLSGVQNLLSNPNNASWVMQPSILSENQL
jgi:hypothetical protein